MSKTWMKAGFLAAAILLFGSPFAAVSGAGAEDKGGGILVEMKGGNITMEDFRQKIIRAAEESGVKAGLPKEPFLEEMVRTRLFVLEARSRKMDERKDIAAAIQDAVDNILATSYLREEVFEKIRITDEEIKDYMEKNPGVYKAPEMVGVSQIVIAASKDATPEVLDTARKRGEEALARVKAGEDFAKVAVAYSRDRNRKMIRHDRYMVFIKKGDMGKEFDDAVFNLKRGEISPLLRVPEGFIIVRVEEHRAAKELTLKEVRPHITTLLRTEKERVATEALVKELSEKYGVKIHKEMIE